MVDMDIVCANSCASRAKPGPTEIPKPRPSCRPLRPSSACTCAGCRPSRRNANHFPWLAKESPALLLTSEVEGAGEHRVEVWRPRRGENAAKLRVRFPSGTVQYYEGEKGAERMVRAHLPSGTVRYYEGEKDAERMVCAHLPSTVRYYEGEKDAERRVRAEFANSEVWYYEGEKGAERKVRAEFPSGNVQYFEGKRGAERMVRAHLPCGTVRYYEGEKGAERKVRTFPALCERDWTAAIAYI